MGKQARRETSERLLAKARAAHAAGQLMQAIAFLEALVSKDSEHLDGHFFLGSLLAQCGRYDGAAQHLELAAQLNPRSPQILNNLGNLKRMQGDHVAALADYQRALTVSPGFSPALLNVGFASMRLKQWREALQAFEQLDPQARYDLDVLVAMAEASQALGMRDSALLLYRQAQELDPEDRKNLRVIVAELSGAAPPPRHANAQVIDTYRRKAAAWDSDVRRPGDSYYGPENIHALLRDGFPSKPMFNTLDLGCGTGLCGPFLRAASRHLVGVDLSPDMLQQATAKGLYDELHDAELLMYLRQESRQFDLMVAAGVFIMFSELDEVLAEAARCLVVGGKLAFTLYRAESKDIEIRWNHHFGHSEAYVRRAALAAGLELVCVDAVIHESANGIDQPGFAVLCRKA